MGERAAVRPWRGMVAVAGCVALQLGVAAASVDARTRAAALVALAAIAVALSLRQAMGGLQSRALRLAIVGPVVFSIVLTVVLTLDAGVRGGALLR